MVLDNLTFGVAVTLAGMGGTLVCLLCISFIIDLVKKIFPYKESNEKEGV